MSQNHDDMVDAMRYTFHAYDFTKGSKRWPGTETTVLTPSGRRVTREADRAWRQLALCARLNTMGYIFHSPIDTRWIGMWNGPEYTDELTLDRWWNKR